MPNIRQKSNSKDKEARNIRGLNWSRMSEERELVRDNSEGKIGPGSYEIPKMR